MNDSNIETGLFCKRVRGAQVTSAIGACVRELGRSNRKEKLLERVTEYWLRLLEADETNPIGDAL
jgi:hypothetical protein